MDAMWIAFQPIVDPAGSMRGYEAFLRSDAPDFATAASVLELAETLDRSQELGRLVRERVAGELAAAIPSSLVAFVNLHPHELLDERLFDTSAPLSLSASHIVLEITERASLSEVPDVKARVARLRALGYRIAIDDLGAGYAGLTSITLLEPEIVKLDMSLVRDIDRAPTSQRVVAALTAMCQSLGVLTVAEGVETQAERDTVVELGCDLLQGYFFARPTRGIPQV
ncbi:MAG: EAL domain-containing protein [Myxococcota bacterium]